MPDQQQAGAAGNAVVAEGHVAWTKNALYEKGALVSWNGAVYKALQTHTANAINWNPGQAPALWQHQN